eukprot:6085608-Amphidinium_carterae.1
MDIATCPPSRACFKETTANYTKATSIMLYTIGPNQTNLQPRQQIEGDPEQTKVASTTEVTV